MCTLLKPAISVFLGATIAFAVLGMQSTIVQAQIIEERAQSNPNNLPIPTTIGDLIQIALGMLGAVALVFIILGGFRYVMAGGNDDGQVEARRMIGAGVIALAVILSAWAITQFVVQSLAQATQ